MTETTGCGGGVGESSPILLSFVSGCVSSLSVIHISPDATTEVLARNLTCSDRKNGACDRTVLETLLVPHWLNV